MKKINLSNQLDNIVTVEQLIEAIKNNDLDTLQKGKEKGYITEANELSEEITKIYNCCVIDVLNFNGTAFTTPIIKNNTIICGYSKFTIPEAERQQLEIYGEECKFVTIHFNEFDTLNEIWEQQYTQDNWKEISEEKYFDALECLPPMNWRTIVPGVNIFCISEAFTSHLHSHYLKLTNSEGAKYYTAIRSRFITNEEILNQIKSL